MLKSVPAMAKASGISYWTLLRLIHESKLPAVQIPGRRAYLIDPADLDDFIESFKTGTKTGTKSHIKAPKTTKNHSIKKIGGKSKSPIPEPYYLKFRRRANG